MFIGIFIFLLLPYFLHFALRWSGKRNSVICSIHIIITLALLISFFGLTISAITEPVISNTSDIRVLNNLKEAGNGNSKIEAITYVIVALISVQAIFIVCFWFLYWGTFESK